MNTDANRGLQKLDQLARLSNGAAALALAGMAITQTWQVFARYVLHHAPPWTEPLTLILLATTLAFGAAASVHQHGHFRFPLLVALLPMFWQRACHRLSAACVLVIGVAMTIGAGTLAVEGFDIRMAGTMLPQSAAFVPLALGGALMALFALPQIWSGQGAAS
ncbi:hypothetical protein C7S18_14185 [Ahniella affigens]|uniref:TRAP transporter small permease protein n=1 Tax=Ahniella affigens TaxID=2021234 RepID=A0A2P1PTW4_9GAMM|nr:TRAP transporter small permease subunit [Ahniella affigens]AVP98270.1 hypothetical protein C7S18_14185 [Ahniella affigens]